MTEPQSRGRKPGQPSRPADEIAIENLQNTVSRLLWYVAENPNDTLGVRLARCARAGVERARAEKGLALVEAALLTARTQMEAAYAAPAPKAEGVKVSRPTVSL